MLEIGKVWKAKSALEIMDLFGNRITDAELDRFFSMAEEILTTPDPKLELPDEERFMAQIHGKVRANSGFFISSVFDTIVRLSVRGAEMESLAARNVGGRVSRLILTLLENADETRWLSLGDELPALAEAAPNEFLTCVERSLSLPNSPITRLLKETSESGLFGKCWHAGLLWALETVVWAPERLARVSLILAKLSEVEIKGNWANSPMASLVDIYRTWFPQTAASVDQRIASIDTLIQRLPEAAFKLLDKLTHLGPDMASHTHRPAWRDDDAGAGHGATGQERHAMLTAAADRQIKMSKGIAARIATLIPKLRDFDKPRIDKVLAHCRDFAKSNIDDNDKEILRAQFRQLLHWQRNYGDEKDDSIVKDFEEYETLYSDLEPVDLFVRHAWLFSDGWPQLPSKMKDEGIQLRQGSIAEARQKALREIYDSDGWRAVSNFARSTGGWYVGQTLANIGAQTSEFENWILGESHTFDPMDQNTNIISGMLSTIQKEDMLTVVSRIADHAVQESWDIDRISRFLALAPEITAVWDIVKKLGNEIEQRYWQICRGNIWRHEGDAEFQFGFRKLLDVKRPLTALSMCYGDFKTIDPEIVAEMLEGIVRNDQPDGPRFQSHVIKEAIKRLEESGSIERNRLIRLEFSLIPAFGYEGEDDAKSLYLAIMNDPKLFIELLCILYKPRNRVEEEIADEFKKNAANTAWRIFHSCKVQPGTGEDGKIKDSAFHLFIQETRQLALEADRLDACDSTLGQILAHAPADEDGVWPCLPARDVLDLPANEAMRNGFAIGVYNKRGVHSRGALDGGDQEREIENRFRGYARVLHNSHPLLAATLDQIADSYKRDGISHDLSARLRREEH